jgi:hypothetical protein
MTGKPQIPIVEGEMAVTTFSLAFPDHGRIERGSNPSHQAADSYIQGVCKGLNRKEAWIFHTAFDATKKSSVDIRLGGESFLRQLSLDPDLSNTSAELFCNVMAHSRHSYPEHTGAGCRLYPTAGLTLARYATEYVKSEIPGNQTRTWDC